MNNLFSIRSNSFLPASSVLLLVLFSLSNLAASEVLQHNEIIVTASQFSADEIDTAYQTGHVTVIKSDQFESKMATVADVLRRETGVQMRQTGGLGSYASVSVRGSTGAQVNVFLDGVLVNDAHGGSVDLSQFLLNGVESIELYRGNVPIQLGNAGIGGAINIKTKRSVHELRQLTLGSGSFGAQKVALNFSTGENQTRYFGSLEHLTSDNDYELLNTKQTTNNSTDDQLEKRQNAGLDQSAILLSVNHQINQDWQINSVLNYTDKTNGIPNVSNEVTNEASLDVENTTLQVKLDQKLNSQSALSYLIYGGRRETLYDDTENRVGLAANLDETRTNTVGLKTVLATNLGAHYLNLGVQLRYEDYLSRDRLRGLSQALSRSEFNLAVQDEWLSDSGKLLLTGRLGLRFLKDKREGQNDAQTTSNYLDKHLGLRYQWTDSATLTANISQDIRLPNLYELYGDLGSTIANEDLKEEQAWNTDIGVKSRLWDIDLYSGIFYRQLKDAIVMVYDARGIGKPDNISKANLYGVELELSRDIIRDWRLGLKATHLQSENRSAIRSSRGNPLPGQYENTASINNTWTHNELLFQLEYVHRSKGYYDTAATAELPTSNQYHFSIKYPFNAHRLELQIKNLNDERIADFNRYPGPGRSAFLSYTLTF